MRSVKKWPGSQPGLIRGGQLREGLEVEISRRKNGVDVAGPVFSSQLLHQLLPLGLGELAESLDLSNHLVGALGPWRRGGLHRSGRAGRTGLGGRRSPGCAGTAMGSGGGVGAPGRAPR